MRTLTFTEAALAEALGNVQCLHDMSVELIAECVFENAPACSTCNDAALIGDAPIECPDCCGLEAPAPSAEADAVEVVGYRREPGQPNEPLMTVAQHQRIVAAKDAALEAADAVIKELGRVIEDQWRPIEAERDELRAQLAAQQAAVPVGWILAADQVPRSGKAVLAFYLNSHGKGRRIRAEYIARWTVPAEGFDPDPDTECVEYSEQDDVFYILEGWYELVDNWDDYSRIAVNEGVVTHWVDMPIAPAAPQQGEQFPQPKQQANPCGECHLPEDETCDVCGATASTVGLGVVLPKRKPLPDLLMASYHEAQGWNTCLDEIARLNADRSAQTDYPECSGDESDCPENEGFGCCGRGRSTQTDAARDVLAERQRQISAEGWTPEHDDAHSGGELADAAACYALWSGGINPGNWREFWPWAPEWLKHSEPRRMLVKACALILAEIERLDRSAQGEKP